MYYKEEVIYVVFSFMKMCIEYVFITVFFYYLRIDGGILKVNTKYANLLVEYSKDDGKTWNDYEEAKIEPGTKILLRSK